MPKSWVELGNAPEMLTYRNLLKAKRCDRGVLSILLYPDRLQAVGDLFRGHRDARMLSDGVAGTGDGTADEDLEVHGPAPVGWRLDFALDRATLASPVPVSQRKDGGSRTIPGNHCRRDLSNAGYA